MLAPGRALARSAWWLASRLSQHIAAAPYASAAAPAKNAEESGLPLAKLLINGKFVDSASKEWVTIHNPATGQDLGRVPLTTPDEFQAAVTAAKEAFPSWRRTPVSARARVMLRFLELMNAHKEQLARLITVEQGKTLADAHGDVFRGQEVVEMAAGIAPFLLGNTMENVAGGGIDCYSLRLPLGVVAGVCPFNFPAMVPLWLFPLAVTAGNCFILKPSERNPGAAVMLADLAQQAGLPPGVLNIVHGSHEVVNMIVDHPDVKAISFVGSDAAGRHIYQRASALGKRVQANLGAKNHAVVMPDADAESTVQGLVGAAFGAAGQRCMAISAAVFVGGSDKWRGPLVEHARALRLNGGLEKEVDVGPMISPQAKARAEAIIGASLEQGAECWLDGRGARVPGFEGGNFLGPTLLGRVQAHMRCYKEEVFAPVLSCLEASSLDHALDIVNANPQGNGCAMFTTSGAAARRFQSEVDCGMVGINVPIPVPLPFFSFTGWKGSFAGDLHMYGREGVQFYTQCKTVTARWERAGAAVPAGGKVGSSAHGGKGAAARLPGLDRVGAS